MEVIYWLIPVAIIFLSVAIAAFVWAVKNDQYSDLESPAYRILLDDDSPTTKEPATKAQSHKAENE
nr:cbb3-type cytochrome oxidase assembly protein CcoS [Pleionea sp. CnH1-48]